MNNLKARWSRYSWETRWLILFGALAALPLLASLWPEAKRGGEAPASIDTHIPRGFVLVPIEVENYEALDSVLGNFGYVDLYRVTPSGSRQAVGRNLRLLRAPRNPTHFAVLVRESQSSEILSHKGSYVVVVRRPGEGTEFVNVNNTGLKPRRKIIYGGQP